MVEKTTPTRSKERATPSRKTPQLGHRTRKLHQSHTNTPFPTSGSCSHSARIMQSPNARAASANQLTPLREGSLAKRALLRPRPIILDPTQPTKRTCFPFRQPDGRTRQERNKLRKSSGRCRQVCSMCARSGAGQPLRITPYFVGAMRHPCQGRSRGRRGTLFLKRSWGTASKSRLFLTQSNIRSLRRMTWSWANHRRVNSQ